MDRDGLSSGYGMNHMVCQLCTAEFALEQLLIYKEGSHTHLTKMKNESYFMHF